MKKITALILSVIMLASVATVPAYGFGFSVVQDYSTNEWINNDQMSIIGMTGIAGDWDEVSDMGKQSEEIVTRWYMAKYICSIANIAPESTDGFEAIFYDLTSEHEGYKYVKAVVNAGYMQGEPNGKFRADDPITTMEAARVLLNALGYKPYIAVTSFQKALNKTELLNGVPDAKELNHAQMLKMIYNAFMSPAIRQTAYEMDAKDNVLNIEYAMDEDYLGLEHWFNIIYSYGILDSVYNTGLIEAATKVKNSDITIDGVTYGYSDELLWAEPYQMLGYNVNFYYQVMPDSSRYIKYMYANDRNEEFVLTHNDIASFTNGTYKYYDKSDRVKTIALNNRTSVIYNDIANPGHTDAEMVPKFGTVTFIDNNSDNKYDVVKVDDYRFNYISLINEDEQRIYDDEAKAMLDFKDADELEVLNEGKPINLGRLKKSNMIAIKRSSANSGYDKAVINMIKPIAKKIKVNSVAKKTFTGGGVTYTKWKDLTVDMNEVYNLFEFEKEIVMVIKEDGAAEYGYLMGINVEGEFNINTIQFKVSDVNGNIMVYDGAKTVYIDGVARRNASDMDTDLKNTAGQSNGYDAAYPYAQPVKYELNTDGKLLRIDTLYLNTAAEEAKDAFLRSENDSQGVFYSAHVSALYNNGTTKNINVGVIDTTTQIIFVPNSRGDEDSYMKSSLEGDKAYTTVDVTCVDDAGTAGAVFVYYDQTSPSLNQRALIVTALRQELDTETGDVNYIVEGQWYGARFVSYNSLETIYNDLAIGDVIRVAVDKKNKIISYSKLFDINKEYTNREDRWQRYGAEDFPLAHGYKTLYGTVLVSKGNVIKFTQSMPDDVEGWDPTWHTDSFRTNNAAFFKYTEVQGNPTIETATIDEIITYAMDPEHASKVLINSAYGAYQIYIVE